MPSGRVIYLDLVGWEYNAARFITIMMYLSRASIGHPRLRVFAMEVRSGINNL